MTRSRRLHYGPSRHQVGRFTAPSDTAPTDAAPTDTAKGQRTAPMVVLLHGGTWAWPYNRWVMWLLERDVKRRGWGCFNADYRRLGRFGGGGGWPETFDDARSVVELMTKHGAALGVDPGRVVVVGHSAGGHLALVGAATAAVRPALVVSMAGPTDLERMLSNGSEPVEELTRAAPAAERWALTSPMHMVPIGVPAVCVHGEDDTTVSPGHSTRFVEAARQAGDSARLVIVPGEDHRDPLRPSSGIWAAVTVAIADRLRLQAQV